MIVSLYKQAKIKQSYEMDIMFSDMIGGFTREIAQLKADGKMSMSEGRSPITSSAYQYLAGRALAQKEDFSLYTFVHCFLLLCWNLIARCLCAFV